MVPASKAGFTHRAVSGPRSCRDSIVCGHYEMDSNEEKAGRNQRRVMNRDYQSKCQLQDVMSEMQCRVACRPAGLLYERYIMYYR